jgi:hypothetical protein
MAKKHDVYPRKYFTAADYPDDWALVAQVETCRRELFPGKRDGEEIDKLVVYFKGIKSGLVVAPTVWNQIAEVMASDGVDRSNADDYDFWKGHWIEMYRDRTPFGSKGMVPCIRVREPAAAIFEGPPSKAKAKAKAKKKPDQKPDLNDSIDI